MVLLVAADAPQALRTASASIFLIRDGDVVEESLYVAASVVRIAGTIEGDLVVVARDHLDVSGRVEGDVIGFATTADITGVVTGSVRLAGVDLDIGGDVGRDVVGVGRDVYLGGSVGADTLVWSRSLIAGGEVGHDMGGRTFGRTIIGGTVGRDVEMTVGRMVVLDGAHVVEDLGYRSSRAAVIDPGAVIGGTAVHRLPLAPDFRVRAWWLMLGFVAFMLFLAVGILTIRSRSDRLEREVAHLARHPVRCLLRGLIPLGVLALPVAVLLGGVVWGPPGWAVGLAVSGLVVVPFVLILLAGLVCNAPFPVLIALGRLAGRGRLNPYVEFVLSAVPVALLLLIPYVGPVAGLGVLALGAGSAARAGRSRDTPAVAS